MPPPVSRRQALRSGGLAALAALGLLGAGACGRHGPLDPKTLRVGHFPNVTHAHGLVGHQFTRAGKRWFEQRLGEGVRVEWYVYNAGPLAMEALLAGALDLAYVGPSPALNAHIRSGGDDVRVVAGAAVGGSALVVHGDGRLREAADFRGRRIGTPQLGNTQDVACRAWLLAHGLRVTQTGGDATVIPTQSPDQLSLFKKGDLDAAWTVEPWVSRLEIEAGGKVLVEEPDSPTTVLVASAELLSQRRDLARAFVQAHRELTDWLAKNPAEAKAALREEILAETHQAMSVALLDRCWPRLRFDAAVPEGAFARFVEAARSVGFLKGAIPLTRLVEVP